MLRWSLVAFLVGVLCLWLGYGQPAHLAFAAAVILFVIWVVTWVIGRVPPSDP